MVNEWTRDDLPVATEVVTAYLMGRGRSALTTDVLSFSGVYAILDGVVEHLNAHHPKPGPDRWRRVEQERDQARASLHEAYKVAQSYKVDAYQATERAEAAEARTGPVVSRADIEKALDTGIRGTTDGGLIDQDTSVPSGECVRLAVDAVCDLLGIEAERAVDPVEAKARELWEVARFEDGDEWPGLLQVERDCYRRMASHVLGREADQ